MSRISNSDTCLSSFALKHSSTEKVWISMKYELIVNYWSIDVYFFNNHFPDSSVHNNRCLWIFSLLFLKDWPYYGKFLVIVFWIQSLWECTLTAREYSFSSPQLPVPPVITPAKVSFLPSLYVTGPIYVKNIENYIWIYLTLDDIFGYFS